MRKKFFVSVFAFTIMFFMGTLSAFAGIEHIDSTNEFRSKVLDSKGFVLVDFWASWCGPCIRQGQILEEFAPTRTDIRIVKFNTEKDEGPSMMYRIEAIPTLIIFKDGKLVDRWSGVTSIQQLNERIDRAMKIKTSK